MGLRLAAILLRGSQVKCPCCLGEYRAFFHIGAEALAALGVSLLNGNGSYASTSGVNFCQRRVPSGCFTSPLSHRFKRFSESRPTSIMCRSIFTLPKR